MKKWHVRVMLLVFLGLLGIQYLLSMKDIEPYPTIMYPEFSYLLPEDKSISIKKPDFVATFANGEKQKVDYYQLFANVPISHVNHLVVLNLNPETHVRPEQFQDKPFKQFKLGRFNFEFRRSPQMPTESEIAQRADFFRKRLEVVTGRPDPVALDITWYDYDFVFGEGLNRETRKAAFSRHFDLVGGAKL